MTYASDRGDTGHCERQKGECDLRGGSKAIAAESELRWVVVGEWRVESRERGESDDVREVEVKLSAHVSDGCEWPDGLTGAAVKESALVVRWLHFVLQSTAYSNYALWVPIVSVAYTGTDSILIILIMQFRCDFDLPAIPVCLHAWPASGILHVTTPKTCLASVTPSFYQRSLNPRLSPCSPLSLPSNAPHRRSQRSRMAPRPSA